MKYKIEHGIPAPSPYKSNEKYPWDAMKVGDSFFVPGGVARRLQNAAWAASRGNTRKFRARTVEGGVRIWRVK